MTVQTTSSNSVEVEGSNDSVAQVHHSGSSDSAASKLSGSASAALTPQARSRLLSAEHEHETPQTPLAMFQRLVFEATGLIAFMADNEAFHSDFDFTMPEYLQLRYDSAKSLRVTADHIEDVVRGSGIARTAGGGVAIASGLAVIGGIVAAPFTLGMSLGLTIGGLTGGVASAATTATAGIVKNSTLKSDGQKVAQVLEYLRPLDDIVFTLLHKLQAICTALQDLAEHEPEVEAWLQDSTHITALFNSMGDHLRYDGHDVTLTPRSLQFVKGFAEFIQADMALIQGVTAGMAAPGLALPFTQTIIVAAGGTAAKLLSSSFAVFGIGFGIWDIHAGMKDIKLSDHAIAYRQTAEQMDVQTKHIATMIGN
ncbi:hypothetical protein HDU77_008292 [Chytriomyces hyalinus]|nr:hypothetical protein HDU77_008292 [Chytriomyces hyalinus]